MGMSKGEKMEAGSLGDSESEVEAGKWTKLQQGNNEGVPIAAAATFMGNFINSNGQGNINYDFFKTQNDKNGILC